MKSSTASTRRKENPPAWHAAFEQMMPVIEKHARIAFRQLDPEAREEAFQETACNACQAYARLVELGKTDLAYASVLARYGVSQVREGRKVGGKLNCRDVSSSYCQRKKNLVVERLDHYDSQERIWEEILVEDKTAGPAETAVVRIDFATWLGLLPRRLRKMAALLASGETTSAAARRFRLSEGRISQIRKQLYQAWRRFQGDQVALPMA
jgi:hypothetical protein